nr:hypothetical protein [Lutibacter sp.]
MASGSRTNTPVLLVKLKYEIFEGYGEASMPPLYGETIETAQAFIKIINLSQFHSPLEIVKIGNYIDRLNSGNTAAKDAIDIALHNLIGKILNVPFYKYFNLAKRNLKTSKTIGIDSSEIIEQRVLEADDFNYLKIKFEGNKDAEIIKAMRNVSDKPQFIDPYQGHQILYGTIHLNDTNGIGLINPTWDKIESYVKNINSFFYCF